MYESFNFFNVKLLDSEKNLNIINIYGGLILKKKLNENFVFVEKILTL
jgi:hypothetical protein